MEYKDYYKILGVDKKATAKEIKKSYRKLARKYHPDVNPGDASAESKFKEINEAYEALKDPQKRAAYEQFGHAAFEGGGGGPGGFGPAAGELRTMAGRRVRRLIGKLGRRMVAWSGCQTLPRT